MQEEQLKEILHKYQSGTATDEEIAFLESWYLQHNEDKKPAVSLEERLEDAEAIWNKLHPAEKRPGIKSVWPWLGAVACLLLFFYLGKLYITNTRQQENQLTQNHPNKIVPGSNKAILTLANGKQVILTNAGSGKFGNQGNTSISKTANGQLVYTVDPTTKAPASNELAYNTVTTPMGGQYWVVLSDGTRVFLNAGSSLRYPASFIGNERRVELKGEAYFEVVHNNAAPFRIVTGSQVIEDIGTKFNISAYDDEPAMKTTLLEGAVKVSVDDQHVFLKPGQQAQVSNADRQQTIKVIRHANLDEAMAWKNGLFEFNNADIKQVMNNTSRWYDFKVIYENKVPDLKISGRISRNVNFSGLIDLLKFEGVKFRIAGRNVTIIN
ncbi:MAG: FecR domain-containing protein [Bacteroidota bacterium]|nr:FecR domain-containing protein [Bacteroidota bacterium]